MSSLIGTELAFKIDNISSFIIMKCVKCNENLKKADYKGIKLDYCDDCQGIWFDRDELRQVKDKEDEFLRWVDVDPWEDEAKFKISESSKSCPVCEMPLYAVKCNGFLVEIDLCNVCHGIWLDKGEFDKIIDYMKEKVEKERLSGYLKDIGEEFAEIFACLVGRRVGPERISDEIADFLVVMKLFEYRLLSKMPAISQIIARLPG